MARAGVGQALCSSHAGKRDSGVSPSTSPREVPPLHTSVRPHPAPTALWVPPLVQESASPPSPRGAPGWVGLIRLSNTHWITCLISDCAGPLFHYNFPTLPPESIEGPHFADGEKEGLAGVVSGGGRAGLEAGSLPPGATVFTSSSSAAAAAAASPLFCILPAMPS